MKKQTRVFYLCLIAFAWLGLTLGNATVTQQVNAVPSKALAVPATLAVKEGCSAGIGNIKIQRASGGNNFVVSWDAPSPCLNEFEVSLTVIKLSGAERTDTKKLNSRTLVAAFSFAGDGDLNPIKSARATVKGTGVLAAKIELTKSLGIGPGVGSSAPTPVPTFRLFGRIRNPQGSPLFGVKLTFDLVGVGPLRQAPAPVETNNQGRWQQDGFPVGAKVRIAASKRFFVFEPESRVVSEGGEEVQFVGRPADAVSAPAPTFSVIGFAKLNNLSQATQTGLGGAQAQNGFVRKRGRLRSSHF